MSKRSLRYILLTSVLACLLLCRNAFALTFAFTESQALADLRFTAPSLYDTLSRGIANGAAMWQSVLADDVTVSLTLDVNSSIGGLAGAAPHSGKVPYAALQARLPNLLPSTPPAFAVGAFQGLVDTSEVWLTSAQMRALNLYDTPLRQQQSDGVVVISLSNQFDADPTDGITQGAYDLSAVMAHELAHGLGILSSADGVFPGATGTVTPTLWDYSRYSAAGVHSLDPERRTYLSLDNGATDNGWTLARGTGVSGPQSSHFDVPVGTAILNHSFVSGTASPLSDADRAAMTASGWTVRPHRSAGAGEPSAGWLFGSLLLILLVRSLPSVPSVLRRRATPLCPASRPGTPRRSSGV